jgi:hypothetical protein
VRTLVKDSLHKFVVGKEAIKVELAVGTPLYGLIEELVVSEFDGSPPIFIFFVAIGFGPTSLWRRTSCSYLSGDRRKGCFDRKVSVALKRSCCSETPPSRRASHEGLEVSQHVPGGGLECQSRLLAQIQQAVAVIRSSILPLLGPVVKFVGHECFERSTSLSPSAPRTAFFLSSGSLSFALHFS